MKPNVLPPDIRIVLLSGEEFQRSERLDEILEAAVDTATRDFNRDILFPQDIQKSADVQRFADIVMSYPMMAERRVVAIRFWDDVGKNSPDVKKKIAAVLKDTPETTLVLIEGEKVALTPKPPARFMKEESFKPVYDDKLPYWIQERFRKLGKKAEKGVVELLANNIGNQLRELDGEIEKIAMIAGDSPTATGAHAEKVVGEFRRFTIYALQNAVGTGDFAEAIHVLRALSQEERNRETYYNMSLASHIMKIAGYNALVKSGVSPAEAKKATGFNDWFWNKNDMSKQTRLFTEKRALQALTVLADTDSDLKRSRIDKELIMELALARIMG
jgi:DNA polymerase III subunit delta